MKKTAVQEMIDIVQMDMNNEVEISSAVFMGMLEQAKEMEKEQIIKAFDEGQEYEYQYHINSAPKFDSETYYQETYKQD